MSDPTAPDPNATPTPPTDGGLNFDVIETSVMAKFKTAEAAMKARISNMAEDPTMSDMVAMQMESQKWSMFGELTTTLTKSLADFSKKCIQQSG